MASSATPINEIVKLSLASMAEDNFAESVKIILGHLGYRSSRTLSSSNCPRNFVVEYPPVSTSKPGLSTKSEERFLQAVSSVDFVFQITDEEVASLDDSNIWNSKQLSFDNSRSKSFLFFAVELNDENYTRGNFAEFTREINKRFFAPSVVFFRANSNLTIAIAERRPNRRQDDTDVLESVTLIKDIRLGSGAHRAQLEILSDLSLQRCFKWIESHSKNNIMNFDGLMNAWLANLNLEKLNKGFYRELSDWYERAVKDVSVEFPVNDAVGSKEQHLIRLVTRILFVWFIKEKKLIAEELFDEEVINEILLGFCPTSGNSYYRVVLQNLFFATLNTEISARKFCDDGTQMSKNFQYLFRSELRDSDRLLKLFSQTPFVNGGLFDCLDSTDYKSDKIDCFTEDPNWLKQVNVPNHLFFGPEGLFQLFKHYKFTVEENTPLEYEVALDPELLGRVFENLLATYNPETKLTARKQTGSFYTPREIVDYMVESSLVGYLSRECKPDDDCQEFFVARLQYLLDHKARFDDASELFSNNECRQIIRAISHVKVLDPAVGSGAFPMSMLQKLTLALKRLDPINTVWEDQQKELALSKFGYAHCKHDESEIQSALADIRKLFNKYREVDYVRKLFLIQNSIFGVDIQQIACQLAKLRFFISLIIEQNREDDAPNFGIRPLPNLETRFVAADTLRSFYDLSREAITVLTHKNREQLRISHSIQHSEHIESLFEELRIFREQYFHAATKQLKLNIREADEKCRCKIAELVNEIEKKHFDFESAKLIANWDPYDQIESASWFDPKYMFGLGNSEAFDILIGNPPYIQLQRNQGELANRYKDQHYETFSASGDIYCLFYERGFELLVNGGHLCYITSNKWMRAAYGEKLRKYLTLRNPKELLDFSGVKVFESATVDTCIHLVEKNSNELSTIAVSFKQNYQSEDIREFVSTNKVSLTKLDSGPWFIGSKNEIELKEKIEAIGAPLTDSIWGVSIYRGILTGCNNAFIIDNKTKDALIAEDPTSENVIKPIVSGKDLKPFCAEQKTWLIDTHSGYGTIPPIDVENFKGIKRYLDKYYDLLQFRYDQGVTPYNLRSCAYYGEFLKEKIVWGNISYRCAFCLSSADEFVNAPANFLVSQFSKYLLGVMNSKIFNFEFTTVGIPLGEAYEWKKQYVRKMHVPKPTAYNEVRIGNLVDFVDELIVLKNANKSIDTMELEHEIDHLVYALYDLNSKEIRTIENARM